LAATKQNQDYEVADLGFYVNTFTKSQAKLWGFPIDSGLQISVQTDKLYNYNLPAINPTGPAKNSELKEGDILASVDGQELNLENNIGKILSYKKPNDQIKLAYYRLNPQTKTWEKFETNYNLGSLKAWNEDTLKDLKLGDIQL
jgi:S1-C subfamily serine protease